MKNSAPLALSWRSGVGFPHPSKRAKVEQSADALTSRLRSLETAAPVRTLPGADALAATVKQFKDAFDPRSGGL